MGRNTLVSGRSTLSHAPGLSDSAGPFTSSDLKYRQSGRSAPRAADAAPIPIATRMLPTRGIEAAHLTITAAAPDMPSGADEGVAILLYRSCRIREQLVRSASVGMHVVDLFHTA